MNLLYIRSAFSFVKRINFVLLLAACSLLLVTSCKKTSVDATNVKTLQSSINDLASSLTTLEQVKFNEALYIIKTFGVEAEGDYNSLIAMGKLIDGKKVPEIFAMADSVAQKNGIEWASNAPPSLGEMNIFGSTDPQESDPNDIAANSVLLKINPAKTDPVLGVQSLQIVPRLADARGKEITFEGAGLEVVLEVFSGGTRLITSKNLMQNNNFKGFTLRYSSLPAEKIISNAIDITVSVKTTKKTLKMSAIGVAVNESALLMPTKNVPADTLTVSTPGATEYPDFTEGTAAEVPPVGKTDPKSTVSRFLNNLAAQNLRGAYETADNPAWGSFDKFSNPTTGFGAVKNVAVKNVTTNSNSGAAASVSATYDITDKDGKTTSLMVTFGLKNVNGDWKINSYKIN